MGEDPDCQGNLIQVMALHRRVKKKLGQARSLEVEILCLRADIDQDIREKEEFRRDQAEMEAEIRNNKIQEQAELRNKEIQEETELQQRFQRLANGTEYQNLKVPEGSEQAPVTKADLSDFPSAPQHPVQSNANPVHPQNFDGSGGQVIQGDNVTNDLMIYIDGPAYPKLGGLVSGSKGAPAHTSCVGSA